MKIIKKIIRLIKYPQIINHFNKWYFQTTKTGDVYVCIGGIGDIVWFLSFWEQYKKKANIVNYNILAKKQYHSIFPLYGEKNLINFDAEIYQMIMKLWYKEKIAKYPKIQVLAFPKWPYAKSSAIEENFCASLGLMVDDCYRFGAFDLSYEDISPIAKPIKSKTKILIETKNNILLVPYANSRINIPIEFWEKIVIELNKLGYSVYTNIGTKSDVTIKGSKPLVANIDELPILLMKNKFISICARCGLADWLFVNECKQLIIHSCMIKPRTRREWLCSALEKKDSFTEMSKKNKLNENIVDDTWVYIDKNNYTNEIEKIIEKIKFLKNR